MRAACVDIGSNTTRLLVADVDRCGLRVVAEERVFTALGSELEADGRIGAAKLAELAAIVRLQVGTARALRADSIRAVATEAVRRAANGRRLVRELAAQTGIEIEILTAGEEARLAFTGAVGMLERPPAASIAVVDVGGGSSELVIGAPDRSISWWQSTPLGSSTIVDRWLPDDPPTPAQLQTASQRAREAVSEMRPPRPERALAVGGSATSLALVAGRVLDGPAFAAALTLLCSEPSGPLGERLGVDPRRMRLLPAGLVLLQAIAARLGLPLLVVRGGLREGLLLSDRGLG